MFAGLPQPLTATRYHSLMVEEASLPAELRITARSADGLIMALEHARWPVFGVQFHPESILTDSGHRLLGNFLRRAGIQPQAVVASEFVAPAPERDFYARELELHAVVPPQLA
jgi:GMP synthase-like glutamine amidotransferase